MKPLHIEMLTDWIFCRSCEGNLSCWEFLNALVLSYLEAHISLQSSKRLALPCFWPTPSMMVPEPWRRACDIHVPFVTKCSAHTYFLPFDQLGVLVLNLHPLLKEISLMRSEKYTNKWVERHKSSGQGVVLCPFSRMIVIDSPLGLIENISKPWKC